MTVGAENIIGEITRHNSCRFMLNNDKLGHARPCSFCTWEAWLVRTMAHGKTSCAELVKHAALTQDSITSGNPTPTVSTSRPLYTTPWSSRCYTSECWCITKCDMSKVSSFYNVCLRICCIFWPNKISNKDLHIKTGCRDVTTEVKHRRLRWLGHLLRMPPERIPKVAIRWTPPGIRKEADPSFGS